MDRITVLYLIDVFKEIAGAERNLYEVVTRLNKEKFRPIVMCMQGGYLVQSLRDKGIEIYDLDIKRIYTLGAMRKAIKIFKFIKRENVNIVVTYHESSDFFGSILAKLAGVPVIVSSRRDMGYKLKQRHILMYKLINRLFNRIITVSEAVANVIFDRENVLWSRIKTIHNGVEIEKFNKKINTALVKKSIGIDNNWPVVGILAAIRPIKGHKYFLEAASLILKNNPKINFLVVGWYDENAEYFKELQKLVGKLGIKDKVIFTGGRSDTPEMLSIMDICVISSLNEGFSNAVLEAMIMGKPIVATNSGGTPEAVLHEETGILVDPCDSNALAGAISRLLCDEELRLKMGKAGRRRGEEMFKIETMISKIELLFEQRIAVKQEEMRISFDFNFYQMHRIFLRTLKIVFAAIVYYSGLFFLWQRFRQPEGIKILAFHRINDYMFDPLNLNIRVENFEKQIRFLKEKFNIISLNNAVSLIKNKEAIPMNTVVITFDDGFADNYQNAFPLLKKYKVPATIFLSTESVDKESVLWFQKIIYAFARTSKKLIELDVNGFKRKFNISSLEQRSYVSGKVVSIAKCLPLEKRRQLLSKIISDLEISVEEISLGNKMLCWDQVREMSQNGIEFGSHGMSHSILTKLSKKELSEEIKESKKIIEREISRKMRFFGYPNGGIKDFNENIKEMLKKNEYISACTLIRGVNKKNEDLFELKRYCVTPGMYSSMFGTFAGFLFQIELAGIFDAFRKKRRSYTNDQVC